METAYKIVEEDLRQRWAVAEQTKDQAARIQILEIKAERERQKAKARAKAANSMSMWQSGGMIAGAVAGALIAGPTGYAAGASAGATIGGGLGSIAGSQQGEYMANIYGKVASWAAREAEEYAAKHSVSIQKAIETIEEKYGQRIYKKTASPVFTSEEKSILSSEKGKRVYYPPQEGPLPRKGCYKNSFLGSVARGVMFSLSGFGFAIFNFFFCENSIQILPPFGNHFFNSFHLDNIYSNAENHDTPSLRVQPGSDSQHNLFIVNLQKAIVTCYQ